MKEFYPAVKKALDYSFSQRPELGASQIIAMPPVRPRTWNDSEWFEDRSMRGYVAHPGGLRLAGAEMLKEWAATLRLADATKSRNERSRAWRRALRLARLVIRANAPERAGAREAGGRARRPRKSQVAFPRRYDPDQVPGSALSPPPADAGGRTPLAI